MEQRIITVPQLAWHGPKELELSFPAEWDLEVLHMQGRNRPVLSPEEIRRAVVNPSYGPPLRELANCKDEVAIIFDDLTRVTRAAKIIPFLLEELAIAGVPDERVRFIAALGCHGALSRSDLVKKLGADVVSRFAVYNHNAFENCTYVGTTSGGIPLYVNAEVMSCSLKIGVGVITPHIMTGFGGGGKIVLPGIVSLETAEAFHNIEKDAGKRRAGQKGNTGMGVFENNPLQREIAEAVKMVGLDFKVDCLVNYWGEIVAIFAGSSQQAFAAGAAEAKKHYLTPSAADADIVVANNYAKASEAVVGLFTPCGIAREKDYDLVLICNTPDGQAPHFLMGTFGKESAGRLRLEVRVPPAVRNFIVFNEYPEYAARGYFADPEKIFFTRTWEETFFLLKKWHGRQTRVAIYPDASIQYSL
ncbi:MAG: lactate racemase domain-containing protein [Desulfotomaculales bacterium]